MQLRDWNLHLNGTVGVGWWHLASPAVEREPLANPLPILGISANVERLAVLRKASTRPYHAAKPPRESWQSRFDFSDGPEDVVRGFPRLLACLGRLLLRWLL